jgi:hypothetical protein
LPGYRIFVVALDIQFSFVPERRRDAAVSLGDGPRHDGREVVWSFVPNDRRYVGDASVCMRFDGIRPWILVTAVSGELRGARFGKVSRWRNGCYEKEWMISTMREGHAFIGVSLDSELFAREWVRKALNVILARHQVLLFLLADDLLFYTRSAEKSSESVRLKLAKAITSQENRRKEWHRFLQSEVDRLKPFDRERVHIREWKDFSDAQYVRLLRFLRIALDTIPAFKESVNRLTMKHAENSQLAVASDTLATSAGFVIDEIAMCLRVTELADFHFEYYPELEISVLSELYNGSFSQFGLTVEALTGQNPKRQFSVLKFPQEATMPV